MTFIHTIFNVCKSYKKEITRRKFG
nr:unnamed protein product [Callosobruchus analis]